MARIAKITSCLTCSENLLNELAASAAAIQKATRPVGVISEAPQEDAQLQAGTIQAHCQLPPLQDTSLAT
jgi:hypothetical protein